MGKTHNTSPSFQVRVKKTLCNFGMNNDQKVIVIRKINSVAWERGRKREYLNGVSGKRDEARLPNEIYDQ